MSVATASAVNDLRKMTGYPLMDCKNALTSANGDVEKAKEILREKLGVSTATLKTALEGTLAIAIDKPSGKYSLVELSTETDFTANAEEVRQIAGLITLNNVLNIDGNNDSLLADLRAKTGEQISIRRSITSKAHEGMRIASYLHHDKKTASVVVFAKADHLGEDLLKKIAMHLAGTTPAPVAILPSQVDEGHLAKERAFREKTALETGKPPEIVKKIVEGALNKIRGTLSLVGQPFLLDPTKTVGEVLGNAEIVDFKVWKVGYPI